MSDWDGGSNAKSFSLGAIYYERDVSCLAHTGRTDESSSSNDFG